MVGKVSERVLLREGLERTDNGMKQTTWPEVVPINQKNYYTDYMKRDDQVLALRLQGDAAREQIIQSTKDRERILVQWVAKDEDGDGKTEPIAKSDDDGDDDDDKSEQDKTEADYIDLENPARMIVIHPGSQNLRIGFASDPLPKTVPMVLANKAPHTESEEYDSLPRRRFEEQTLEGQFGEEWSKKYRKLSEDLKMEMRANKHKVLPNSKDLVVNYNRRSDPERIPVHNDPLQVEWTEIPASETACAGNEALRIPEDSKPKYKLWWPMQQGWFNENDYGTSEHLYDDFETIIEKAIRTELGLKSSMQWKKYSCIFIIPDLYDKKYVEQMLESCLTWFEFNRVCFIQESMAATFGAGYTQACVVDVGAQKTSITCVEDGMCLEDSRINLKYGGWDVTETFLRMMLFDNFPYEEINLRRRYDWLLAEELKIKHCSLAQNLVSVQLMTFHVRTPNQPTRKYQAKMYDEAYLSAMGFYHPTIFDHSAKLRGRRSLIDMSYNCYESDLPDDPSSAAQLAILTMVKPSLKNNMVLTAQPNLLVQASSGGNGVSTPIKDRSQPFNFLAKVNEGLSSTPATSNAPSPGPGAGPDGTSTPVPPVFVFGRDTATGSPAPASVRNGTPTPSLPGAGAGAANSVAGASASDAGASANATSAATVPQPLPRYSATELANERDLVLPIAPLDVAVLTSISHAARGDEKKLRELLGSVMVVGGGAKIPLFGSVLEDKLRAHRPDLSDKILVSTSARDMDEQVVTWKGASVFAKLSTNDSWITPFEYERLGPRILHHKVMWSW
ncbi:putative arp8-like protein [Ceratocystis lukuohia]|uniref:Arp8-like protein n=1 Tax=Ceratocystis lukuohia TaxID=2019550 RepID=A0ABR4MLJ6_9PEZI